MPLFAGPRQSFTGVIAAGATPTVLMFVKNTLGAKYLKVMAFNGVFASNLTITMAPSNDGVNENGGPYTGLAFDINTGPGQPQGAGGAHWLIAARSAGASAYAAFSCNFIKLMGLYNPSGGITSVYAWPLFESEELASYGEISE